ncbi:MAG: glycosyltransferase [Actinomycetales bacterium]
MATVLAYTSPALGHLYPMMPILLELADRGHHVHVRTRSGLVPMVRAQGLQAEPIDPQVEAIEEPQPTPRNLKTALGVAASMLCDRGLLDAMDFKRAIDDTGADVLIVDTNSWGAIATAQAQSLPWVHFAPYLLPLPSRGTPPFGPGLARRTDLVGRVRDAVVGRLMFDAIIKEITPRINRVRRSVGLPAISSYADALLDCDRMIVTSSEPFDYPHPDWPGHVHQIGAAPWEPPEELPAWVSDLPGPLTLVTTSSEAQSDHLLARVAAQGLAGEPGSVIITMPAGVPHDLATGTAPNIHVARYVPHAPILARTAVAVTHGGLGVTQKALAAGVPVCVVPFGRDQFETAARAVHAEAGTRLAASRLSPVRLRRAVRAAADKRPGAARCAAGFEAAGGGVAGADVVEELL